MMNGSLAHSLIHSLTHSLTRSLALSHDALGVVLQHRPAEEEALEEVEGGGLAEKGRGRGVERGGRGASVTIRINN